MALDFMSRAAAMQDRIVAWRRDFHRHPELAFQERRTASVVAAELGRLGFEVQAGVGQTGVVGVLSGHEDGPTVLVRCDMDALPLKEENETPYASASSGVMHACGHDGHTAIGLAVANLLHEVQGQLRGQVKFVFQPAEEIAEGAQAMIDDGALLDPAPDVVLGLHLWNTLPLGQVGVTAGPAMAGAYIFEVIISGKGGHGASPHETHDPVLAAAQIVTALQSVISRNVDPLDNAVLSVTSVSAGTAYNIIPASAHLKGTIRTFKDETRSIVVERLNQIASGIAAALECDAKVLVTRLTPPLVNDPDVAETVTQLLAPLVQPKHVVPSLMTMGAEDMAIFLQHVPGCFFFVGSANESRNLNFPHHHPRFDIDEQALTLGAAMLATAVAHYVIPKT